MFQIAQLRHIVQRECLHDEMQLFRLRSGILGDPTSDYWMRTIERKSAVRTPSMLRNTKEWMSFSCRIAKIGVIKLRQSIKHVGGGRAGNLNR